MHISSGNLPLTTTSILIMAAHKIFDAEVKLGEMTCHLILFSGNEIVHNGQFPICIFIILALKIILHCIEMFENGFEFWIQITQH